MRTQRADFRNQDGALLGGRLDLPDAEEPVAYAVFAHCFGCTKNLKTMGYLDRALTEARVAVLRFDFTGLGDSEGEFSDTTFTSNVTDVVSAAEYLGENYEAPRLLIGHSLGGAAVIQAARQIPSAGAVVTIASPSELSHLSKTILSQAPEIEQTGEAEVMLAGRRFRIKKQFVDDLEQRSMAEIVGALRLPLLALHAPEDDIVPIAAAERIFEMARYPKSLVALDRADHLLLNQEDAEYAGRIVACWFRRYLS
jgi:alpha-beta hydrolase superfamily lysophospholipase